MAALHQMIAGRSYRKKVALTIAADTQNYVLNTAKATGYQAGISDITLTINSGIYVGSSSTAGIALDVDTSWNANDRITIVNNGFITGCGGNGGSGGGSGGAAGGNGAAGGAALRAQRALTVDNTSGTIGGGGGGGAGGQGASFFCGTWNYYGGGGGGGGQGYSGGSGGGAGPYLGGGTVAPSGGGTGTKTGGAGGGSAMQNGAYSYGCNGGTGGSLGASGGTPFFAGTPQAVITFSGNGSVGAGGNCTTTGSNANITWTATGTRLGTIA